MSNHRENEDFLEVFACYLYQKKKNVLKAGELSRFLTEFPSLKGQINKSSINKFGGKFYLQYVSNSNSFSLNHRSFENYLRSAANGSIDEYIDKIFQIYYGQNMSRESAGLSEITNGLETLHVATVAAAAAADDDDEIAERRKLWTILPINVQAALTTLRLDRVFTEIAMDLGCRPIVWYADDGSDTMTRKSKELEIIITKDDLSHVIEAETVGTFSSDNRSGVKDTLHRISRRCNKSDELIGLTIRYGTMITGTTCMIRDLVSAQKSVLVIGMPGVGKTTLLREYARVLAESGLRVEVVDTSNEIAGDSDTPHKAIGRARRLMVKDRSRQHDVMIEAVQNHSPQVVIIDEIGTKQEARAASDIAQRGVKLIATVHGVELKNILDNPELNGILGGVNSVILSAREAALRKTDGKTIWERKGPVAFDCAIELRGVHSWVVYHNLAAAVDSLLSDKKEPLEVRRFNPATKQISKYKVMNYEDLDR